MQKRLFVFLQGVFLFVITCLGRPAFATDPVCTADFFQVPSFSVSSVECANDTCADVVVYGLPERDAGTVAQAKRLLMPSMQCGVTHQYTVSATLNTSDDIQFDILHKVNGVYIGLTGLFVDGEERFDLFHIPYSPTTRYEIHDGNTVIALHPTVENADVSAMTFECVSGLCEDLIAKKDSEFFRYTASYSEREGNIPCGVFVMETSFNSCDAGAFTTIVEGVLPNGRHYGFSYGDTDLDISVPASTLFPWRFAVEVHVGSYTFIVHLQNRWMYAELAVLLLLLLASCTGGFLMMKRMRRERVVAKQ